MLQQFFIWYSELAKKGSDRFDDPYKSQQIILFNKISILGAGIFVPYSILFGLFVNTALLGLLFCSLSLLATPYFMGKGWVSFAKGQAWLVVHLSTFLAAGLVGPEGPGPLAFLFFPWLIPILLHKDEKGLRIFALSVSIICIGWLELIDYTLFPIEALEAYQIKLVYLSSLISTFVAAIGSAFYFSSGYFQQQQELSENLEVMSTQNIELEKTKQEAIDNAKAKAMFLANMSHEIRTPMNGVIGMTDLLLNTPLVTEQQEYLNIIRTSGESLLTIINDILDFTKIESGKIDLEKRSFSLVQCVEDAVDILAKKAHEKGIELLYLIESDVPNIILGDSNRLRQIIINLTSNALKFTHEGEVLVHIQKTDKPQKANEFELLFSVKDTGIGISKEQCEKLFKAFQQADSSTTRKYGGTGLGLAISQRLSSLMGGAIWVDSEPGQGSTFSFTIATEKGNIAQVETQSQNIDSSVLQGKKLLVVDDNETNRLIIERQAIQYDMEVYTAASGPEALNLLEKGGKFDIAILDCQMPDMDGFELGGYVKDKIDGPMIMLSSALLNAKLENQVRNLFDAYLMKPTRQSHLIRTLSSLLVPRNSEVKRVMVNTTVKNRINTQLAKAIPINILVAEDNLVNQKIIQKMLARMGYEIEIAENGIRVLEMLEQGKYDLIFMDVQMPKMDGLEATQKIYSRWAYKRPVIIAMTANAMQGDREICLDGGMDDYVSKPVIPREVEKMLEKWGRKILVDQEVRLANAPSE